MLIVSHRGNLHGPEGDCDLERVTRALRLGFDVEIDVRKSGDTLWVGHDEPMYTLDELYSQGGISVNHVYRVWHHAKDVAAFKQLCVENRLAFMHADDPYALVSGNGAIWAHPRVNASDLPNDLRGLVLLDVAGFPRVDQGKLPRFPFAVCTDWPIEWMEWLAAKLKAGWR